MSENQQFVFFLIERPYLLEKHSIESPGRLVCEISLLLQNLNLILQGPGWQHL